MKFLQTVLALSISSSPALAWEGDGEGGCPYSKDKSNQDIKAEQVEESGKIN